MTLIPFHPPKKISAEEFKRKLRHRKFLFMAVPDLHGHSIATFKAIEMLRALQLPVVFLGDYVDRGRSSVKTIDLLIEAKKENPSWIFLRGNHEEMLLETWKTGIIGVDVDTSAAAEYSRLKTFPKGHRDFLESLSYYYESTSLLFVHGGISEDADLPVEEQASEVLLWSYDISPHWKGKKIVRGHRLIERPTEFENHISLETGVFIEGGSLCLSVVSDEAGVKQRLLGWIEMSPSGKVRGYYWVTKD